MSVDLVADRDSRSNQAAPQVAGVGLHEEGRRFGAILEIQQRQMGRVSSLSQKETLRASRTDLSCGARGLQRPLTQAKAVPARYGTELTRSALRGTVFAEMRLEYTHSGRTIFEQYNSHCRPVRVAFWTNGSRGSGLFGAPEGRRCA